MTPIGIVRYVALQRRHRRRAREGAGSRQLLRIVGILLLLVLSMTTGVVISGVGAAAGAYVYFTQDLPEPEQIEAAEETFETTKIYDRTGQTLLYEVIDPLGGDRTWVTLDQIPEHLLCATVAIEDRNYWENPGINLRGIARAFWADIRGQQIQGGSSITQQLIKRIVIEEELRYVSPEGPEWKDYERKITEILLAYEISQRYSKEKILEWYLNENFYGNLAYGIEAATRVYFGKSVGDLTLAEAATLAAIPQFPAMNPFDNEDKARERQHIVLDAMVSQGCITPEEAVAAKYESWDLAHLEERYDILYPHFSIYVRKQLENMPAIGPEAVYRGGLRVYTTLDLGLQEQTQCVARAHIRRLSGEDEAIVIQEAIAEGCDAAQFLPPLRARDVGRDHNVSNAAVAVIRPATGEILTMVGSLDYWNKDIDGHFNVAVDGARQPGSSFKPFTYVTLLSQGFNAAHVFLDVRTAFQQSSGYPYVPENYDRKYHGPQRMRQALARSYNIPAVEALQLAGVDSVIRTAHRMGINTLDRGLDYYGLSLTLGGGEVHLLDMVYAFSVFANGGRMHGAPVLESQLRADHRELNPVAILRVEDREGNVLYEYNQAESRDVLSPQLAYLMNSILSDQRARWRAMGYPNALELSNDRPAAAKTGTTNDFRDAWTIGYTPQLAVGVWAGNSDNSEMRNLPGLRGAAPIWHAVMEYALQDEEIVPFTRPDGLVERAVCALSGKLPTEHCPTVNELFIPGTEPTEHCHIHQVFRVNRETGRLCTVHTPPELCEERVYEVYPPEAADWIASLPEDERPATPPIEYDTIYGPSRSDAEVAIITPAPYSYIRSTIPITGNARGGDFNFYRVVFGAGLNPTEWVQVGTDHGDQIDHGVLEFWDVSGLDGLYSLRLSVVDHSMALRETTIQVTVDNISPTLDLTYPEEGSVYELGHDEWVNVNVEVQDYSIARIEFYVDDGPEPFAVRTVAPFNVNWTIEELGMHTFHVIAVDAAGNVTKSDPVKIKVVLREEE
ncbi:MAG: transglycosylase domain-containing protein [Chloroflexota bacterium]|nr:transglycosylase domain-containing protein [Chloroflexota bacterium]